MYKGHKMQELNQKTNEEKDYGLVSIVMPNYNSEKHVAETIKSVLAQTYKNWEILFVDDCSTDNSLEIARSFNDERIKILQNEANSGAAVSRNYALREAKGKWIAFLDSDDLWAPTKLEEQIAFMVENGYHFSGTPYFHVDEKSNPLNVEVTGPKKINKRKMFRYDYLGCLTVMYDHEYVGLIQVEPSLKCRNDYAMWLKVCKKCDCYLYDKNLASYRIRSNSISHSGFKKKLNGHYRLFRYGENMGAIRATWHTLVNLYFGFWKKVRYVNSVKNKDND